MNALKHVAADSERDARMRHREGGGQEERIKAPAIATVAYLQEHYLSLQSLKNSDTNSTMIERLRLAFTRRFG